MQRRWNRDRLSRMILRVLVSIVVLIIVVALAGPQAAALVTPDADASETVRRILPDAKRVLIGNFELPVSSVRYVGIETRGRDNLIVLQFEIRVFPFITVDRAYLSSRCTPITELNASTMSGGRGVTNFATDAELQHLRSDLQPDCP